MKNEIRNAKCETFLPKQSLNKSEWVSTSKSDERMKKKLVPSYCSIELEIFCSRF